MRLIGNVVLAAAALVISFVALISTKYDTMSACAAAAEATRRETPGVLAELAKRDPAVARLERTTRPFPRLREALEARMAERASLRASLKLADRSAVSCAFLVVYREVAPASFRRFAAERALKRRDALLRGEPVDF